MIKTHCKYDQLIDPKTLKNHPKNRNKHGQDQIERLAELYEYQGIRHPIVVSKMSGFIVAGHGRKLAAIRAGIKEMPVVYQDFESSEQEYAFIQSDNAVALWAELDLSGINEDIADLGPDFDINMLGIQDFTIDVADKFEDKDADEMPEEVETIAKLGQIYKLGEHRLMCGDSTDEATVSRLMNGEKADMVFTDPPYGMDLDADYSTMINKDGQAGNKHRQVRGDSASDFSPDLIKTIFNNFGYCKEMIIWGADYFAEYLENKNNGSWLVWDKRVEEKYDKVIGSGFELCWSKAKHKREVIRFEYSSWGARMADHVNGKKPHPTMKPVALIEKIMSKFKNEKNIIDIFGGSGSTLIACEKTNRKCFMSELDPHYIDVIIQRWMKFTGKTAYLVEDQSGKLSEPVPYVIQNSSQKESIRTEFKNTAPKSAGQFADHTGLSNASTAKEKYL